MYLVHPPVSLWLTKFAYSPQAIGIQFCCLFASCDHLINRVLLLTLCAVSTVATNAAEKSCNASNSTNQLGSAVAEVHASSLTATMTVTENIAIALAVIVTIAVAVAVPADSDQERYT